MKMVVKRVKWIRYSRLNQRRLAVHRFTLRLMVTALLISGPILPGRAQSISPSALPPAGATMQLTEGYVLGVGDRVRVDIYNVPEYSGEYRVLADGSLSLPGIGAVSVQGFTLQQASQVLSSRYIAVLRRPVVTLTLLEARPITIAIAGEVRRPGSYTVSPTSGVPNLTQALQLAGGVTGTANIREIQVRRPRPANRGSELLTVDLWQLLQQGDLRQDLLLRDGDSIVIPTATAMNLDEARQLANTSFTAPSEPIQVAVVGQVNRPGPHILNPSSEGSDRPQVPTVTQAIQTAGGITQTADIRNIEVRRTGSNGSTQSIKVDFWQLLQAGDLNQDLPLQPGDTVFIPTATALTPSQITALGSASFAATEMTVNVVGEVASPGAIALRPNTPLNQAVLAAGGFNNRARRGTVQLIRLNPDGTVSQQRISVDFAQGVSSENNPALRPNDTVVVGRSSLTQVGDTLGTLLSPVTGVFGLFRLLGL
ncbi:MAG: SLBB domain-containing protein [Oculatellaceae cyanobacterium bins.114]|nr:SLBB domain-containing protein [Oculatellaceae cyanobacterium bins.114]